MKPENVLFLLKDVEYNQLKVSICLFMKVYFLSRRSYLVSLKFGGIWKFKWLTAFQVCDFGMSKMLNDQTLLKTMVGTPAYMAPEVMAIQGYGVC